MPTNGKMVQLLNFPPQIFSFLHNILILSYHGKFRITYFMVLREYLSNFTSGYLAGFLMAPIINVVVRKHI
jgi:hypothetical protein